MTNETMGPHGVLSKRYNLDLNHFPHEAKERAYCGLHKWVDDTVTQRNVLTCNVNLCVKCYGIFHKIRNVNELKKAFKKVSK